MRVPVALTGAEGAEEEGRILFSAAGAGYSCFRKPAPVAALTGPGPFFFLPSSCEDKKGALWMGIDPATSRSFTSCTLIRISCPNYCFFTFSSYNDSFFLFFFPFIRNGFVMFFYFYFFFFSERFYIYFANLKELFLKIGELSFTIDELFFKIDELFSK